MLSLYIKSCFRQSLPVLALLSCVFSPLITSMPVQASHSQASKLTAQQQNYLDAKASLDNNDLIEYQKLRKQLEGYPLTPYLDFHANMDDILASKGKQASRAIAKFKGTALHSSLRYRYLVHTGNNERWHDFLTISPKAPKNIVLQCYYYRALFNNEQRKQAFKGAQQLWLYGHSRPKECDPLFAAWEKAGHPSQELIWQRMLLAFNANELGLLTYLSKKLTQHKEEAQLLIGLYKKPHTLEQKNRLSKNEKRNEAMLEAVLKRLARQDLGKAISLYSRYEQSKRFSPFEQKKLSRYLLRRALIAQENALKPFVDSHLGQIDSDDLKVLRLRWAIRENDQQAIAHYLALLSQEKRSKERWQYWLARTNAQDDDKAERLKSLAQARNFYGFSAASTLKQAVQLQDEATPANPNLNAKLKQDPGLARVSELLALDKLIDARAEWLLLLSRYDNATQAQYALLAQGRGWDYLGVQASIEASLWNDMALRFPLAATPAFEQASQQAKVDIDELRAIARRESAFYPYATSSVGARGLMQLMPATAKATAKKLRLPYRGHKSLYQIDTNTLLGSAYYAQLLKEFDNNRVLATAAYNAGPRRVKLWLEKSKGKLDVLSFIESIPFTETREYVQAVLSYRVIYQMQQHKPVSLFSEQELNYRY
ncbi:transglycosylase SLT domain-containing protein [Shewanella sp. AS1]|uniref:transglycosylase SLT domain-containing protein n=1 Tax=Shewanella sp. AS1 TaxID=2907626 RepID=UPI001F35445C|nr:transglycosylase SLT domain-containing protein [Shewanella sp. AS1]MCE9678822.1 transglycosylase SLT domain-containing protein [Shewanella sp. AS1]